MELRPKYALASYVTTDYSKETKYEAVISSETVNSYSFVLLTDGVSFERFLKNPVMLKNHEYEQIVGRWTELSTTENKEIIGKFEFVDTELGRETEKEFKFGALNAFSVGFGINNYVELDEDVNEMTVETPNGKRTIDVKTFREAGARFVVTDWELTEISIVAVPANPDAIRLSLSKAGYTDDSASEFLAAIEKISKETTAEATKMKTSNRVVLDYRPHRVLFNEIREACETDENIDYELYASFFADVPEKKEDLSAYRFLHHAVDGEEIVVEKGLLLRSLYDLAISGAKNSEEIYAHLKKHAEEIGLSLPEFSDFSVDVAEDLCKHAESLSVTEGPSSKEDDNTIMRMSMKLSEHILLQEAILTKLRRIEKTLSSKPTTTADAEVEEFLMRLTKNL